MVFGRGGGGGAGNASRAPPRDTSFLPGAERVAPHLADQHWKHSIDREENYSLGVGSASKGGQRVDTRPFNIITWEDAASSRLGTGCSSRRGKADVLTLDDDRLSRTASSRLSSRCSRSTDRCGRSKRLGTAGSSYISATSSRLSSVLSEQLHEEREQREAAEEEIKKLRAQLAVEKASCQ
eukprot:TRINITY_DN13537_c0_g1_i1.p1 TRINITY_DN13537_c0_g1~~TRINITY_DN13537_c0_g1_i1.p1  ORF type:complete len:181 (-),score=41.48 TRINITY_DN13537_c0_g1_i1:292-834(-)